MTNRNNSKVPKGNFKFQNEAAESKGTKPTREESTIFEIFVVMIVHICKKSLFFDTNLKIVIYLGILFLLSLIADVLSFPRSYFSRSDNMLNQYFVKLGWFWTLLLVLPFIFMTTYTICCGKRKAIVTAHLSRTLIATFFWYFWTSMFNVVEASYGKCNSRSFDTKSSCLQNGYFWNGFDLSGHCFILIYSSLVLIEEARAINGWERIKDYIRDEEYVRSVNDKSLSLNPLKNLNTVELSIVKVSYQKFTPYIRTVFIAICLLQILWDIMLVSTILYYHIMVEKFVSGVIAILTWFITYRVWFPIQNVLPNSPGEGIFKYNKGKQSAPPLQKRKSLNGKHFMGMPIYKAQESTNDQKEDLN